MSLLRILLAELIAIGIPVAFLVAIYALDLYASSTFRLVLLCFGWGGIGGLGLSYLFNTYVAVPLIQELRLDYVLLYVVFAPVAEEILKSLHFLYVTRQPDFTYFVDGAIYGFASGIGFSITENFMYMRYHPDLALPITFVRAFSVCLMHGAASGLVGVAIGRFRFRRLGSRGLALAGGWAAAILLHAFFNSISQTDFFQGGLIPFQVGVGLAGVGLIVLFVLLGLRAEQRWLVEILDRKMGMTDAELEAARTYGSISFDEIMEPVFEQFPRSGQKIEFFLRNQTRMGIKRKVQQQVSDPDLKEELGREVARLEDKTKGLRKEMGTCARIYVQCVFPEGATGIQRCLEKMVTCDESTGGAA